MNLIDHHSVIDQSSHSYVVIATCQFREGDGCSGSHEDLCLPMWEWHMEAKVRC